MVSLFQVQKRRGSFRICYSSWVSGRKENEFNFEILKCDASIMTTRWKCLVYCWIEKTKNIRLDLKVLTLFFINLHVIMEAINKYEVPQGVSVVPWKVRKFLGQIWTILASKRSWDNSVLQRRLYLDISNLFSSAILLLWLKGSNENNFRGGKLYLKAHSFRGLSP